MKTLKEMGWCRPQELTWQEVVQLAEARHAAWQKARRTLRRLDNVLHPHQRQRLMAALETHQLSDLVSMLHREREAAWGLGDFPTVEYLMLQSGLKLAFAREIDRLTSLITHEDLDRDRGDGPPAADSPGTSLSGPQTARGLDGSPTSL